MIDHQKMETAFLVKVTVLEKVCNFLVNEIVTLVNGIVILVNGISAVVNENVFLVNKIVL